MLDTSTACLALAVMENDRVLHALKASGERNHSVHLLPLTKKVLQEAGIAMSELDGIAVGVGPGSYTGTRIAVTGAKTLAWASNIPISGISSIHALAWSGLETGLAKLTSVDEKLRWIVPMIDARRGQAYTALFTTQGQKQPLRMKDDGIRLMQQWLEELELLLEQTPQEEQPDEIWFVGEPNQHIELLEQPRLLMDGKIHIIPCDMEGAPVGRLGADTLMQGNYDDLHTLVPNYTQLAEAEKLLHKP